MEREHQFTTAARAWRWLYAFLAWEPVQALQGHVYTDLTRIREMAEPGFKVGLEMSRALYREPPPDTLG